jgi:hypothetical protein
MAMMRDELGTEKADELLPLVNGGVTLAKLRGAMHDTCNRANLVATFFFVMRNDAGKEMYGADEWEKMQAEGQGWQDFLCANHSRNLHFDAFSRRFTDYVKGAFGNGLYMPQKKKVVAD